MFYSLPVFFFCFDFLLTLVSRKLYEALLFLRKFIDLWLWTSTLVFFLFSHLLKFYIMLCDNWFVWISSSRLHLCAFFSYFVYCFYFICLPVLMASPSSNITKFKQSLKGVKENMRKKYGIKEVSTSNQPSHTGIQEQLKKICN